MLIRAPAQRIAAAAVVTSACGTTGAVANVSGGSSTGRAPVDDRISAKELRSRCGIDDAIFTAELRRDADGPHTDEEDPGEGGTGDDDEDAVDGGLVVCGGVSPFRGKTVGPADEACGKEAPCGAALDNTVGVILLLPDGEIENI
jgi:hypothetical protein